MAVVDLRELQMVEGETLVFTLDGGVVSVCDDSLRDTPWEAFTLPEDAKESIAPVLHPENRIEVIYALSDGTLASKWSEDLGVTWL